MPEESKNKQPSKLRTLLSGGEEKPADKASPLHRLPRKGDAPSMPEEADKKTADAPPKKIAKATKPAAPKTTDPSSPPQADAKTKGRRFTFGPAFWTITGSISLVVNMVLIIIVLVVLINLSKLRRLPVSDLIQNATNLPGGLYTNFEKMDRAHIKTNIDVNTTIPVKFDLQLNQQTSVILSQDVTIEGALVTVQTGGLNITRARTTIVLPAGTSLPIVLNLTVPVDTTVPVTLNVPVDIALQDTDLHDPFTGLRDVVQPFNCLLNPGALNLDGAPVCGE